MSNEKISELPAGSPAQPGDALPIARSGSNFSIAVSDIQGVQVAINGNTQGVPSTVSSGTLLLAGGNNITLSQLGNSITISGNAGAGGQFSAGVSNIGNTAGNTGVTGTQIVFAGGENITLSQFTSPSGATITISAFDQSEQTQNVINASFGGNTSGALALVSSGTLFLAGGNNVTLSQNGNSVTISANTAAAATLSISAGTTSGAYQGVTFSNSNNVSFGLNNGTITASASQSIQTQASGNIGATGFATTTTNGSVIVGTNNTAGFTLGVPPYITTQSAQTQNVVDVSLSGNTSGALALISSGTMILAGGNNVTLSQAGQSVTISGAAQTNQTLGIYASSQTFGQSSFSTVDARSFTHVGSGNVSVGLSNGSLIFSGATAAPPTTAGINAAGNTTGQSFFSTYQQSSAIFYGAGIISVGWSSNSFLISAPGTTGLSQSNFAVSNTTLGTSGTQTIGQLSFAGAGNVSVGVSNGSIIISGSAAGGGGVNFGVSTGGNTAGATGTVSTGNVVLVGSGPISLSQATGAAGSAATITINAPATSSISGTGQVSVAVAGSTISIGVPTQSLYATGNTTQGSSGTFTAGSFLVNALGNISAGYSNGSLVLSAAGGGAAQSIGVSTGGSTSGNTGIYSGQVVFAGGNNITLSVSSGAAGAQTITISGANAGGAQTGISGIIVSNTTYTSGTVSLVNSNGISFGSSGANGISASYTVPSTAGLISGLHLSANGGTSNNVTGLTFSNSGGVSWGLSTGANVGTMTAAVATTQALYFLGNTTGQSSSSTVGDQTVSYTLGGAISGGMSGGTILLSAPATSSISGTGLISVAVNASTISIGAAIPQLSFYQPLGPIQSTTVTQNGIGTVQVYPAIAPFPFTASRVDMFASVSAAALAASTEAQTLSMYVGIYSLNGSTLSLASSGSQSYAWTNSSGGSSSVLTGLRRFSAPINVNYTGGFDLFIGMMSNTTFANTNGISVSNVVIPVAPAAQLNGLIGQATGNSLQFMPGQGVFSTTSAGMPVSMGLSAISGIGSASNNAYAVPVQFVNVSA